MLENVVDELKKYNIFDVSIFKPTYKQEISFYITNNIHRFDLLILFGGDGTLNEAVNGLMVSRKKPKLLYVPVGTVNDFGNYLKISSDYRKTLKLLNEKSFLIDVGMINERYFIYVLACGKFTNISFGGNEGNNKRFLGKAYYYLKATNEFFKSYNMNLRIDERVNKNYSLLLGMNIGRIAGFKIRKNPNKLNDGKIKVVLFKSATFFTNIAIGLYLLFGIKLKGMVEVHEISSLKIISNNKCRYNTDGEESYLTKEAKIKILKEALEIYVTNQSGQFYF